MTARDPTAMVRCDNDAASSFAMEVPGLAQDPATSPSATVPAEVRRATASP